MQTCWKSGESNVVNNGVLTIFWRSRAEVRDCTFTGNRNGVDDMGGESSYATCVFADNQLDAGLKGFARYVLAVNAGAVTATARPSRMVTTSSSRSENPRRDLTESLPR